MATLRRRTAAVGGASSGDGGSVTVLGTVTARSPMHGWSAEQSGRTDKQGSLLPTYSVLPKQGQLGIGGASAFFRKSNPLFWRSVFAAVAVAYIYGFHASVGRIRINFGR